MESKSLITRWHNGDGTPCCMNVPYLREIRAKWLKRYGRLGVEERIDLSNWPKITWDGIHFH